MRAGLVGRPRAKSIRYQRPCRTKTVNGQGRWYNQPSSAPDRAAGSLAGCRAPAPTRIDALAGRRHATGPATLFGLQRLPADRTGATPGVVVATEQPTTDVVEIYS